MISQEIRRLLETGSAIRNVWTTAFEMKEKHGAENVADMAIGNPAASPPDPLLRALEDVVANPPPDLHKYTPTAGDPEVRERVAAHLDGHGILPGTRAEHVLLTAGASAATNIALRTILEPGDEVILLAPYFPDYPAHVLNHHGIPVPVSVGPDFAPDLERIEGAIGPKTRAVIVNHPNNPSGRQYSEVRLRELADLLRARGRSSGRAIYLISDEPYREVRFTAEPFVSPARVYEHGLMCYSFSKSHSIPGERIGYLAVNPDCPGAEELVPALTVSSRILGFPNAPSLWQRVISRCLDAVVEIEPLRRNRDRLMAALTEKRYEVALPDGAFYLFPRTPGGSDEAFLQRVAQELIFLVPGATFGCAGHFRMAFCVDERTVDLAVRRLPSASEWN